ARLATIALTIVLIGVVFVVATRLFGLAGGVASTLLAAFCPNILAHGHLVTTDLGHALFFFLAVLAYARVLQRPTLRSVCMAGLTVGLAQLTKFTALILYPLLALMTATAGRRNDAWWPRWAAYLVCVVLSLLVLNAGYLFADCGLVLSSYEFET